MIFILKLAFRLLLYVSADSWERRLLLWHWHSWSETIRSDEWKTYRQQPLYGATGSVEFRN